MFPFVRYKILLRFSIILCFVSLFFVVVVVDVLFFAEKKMFSFKTLLKRTFSLLTCYLQFRITGRLSMTLKFQSVQSLRPQNSPYFLRKPRTRNSQTNGLEQMVVPSCLEQRRGGGEGGLGWGSE